MDQDRVEAASLPRVLVIGADEARVAAAARRLDVMGFACETAPASSSSVLRGALLRSPDVVVAVEVGGSWQPARKLLERDIAHLPAAGAAGARPPVLVLSEGASDDERADALASPASDVWDWVDVSCPDREIAARLRRLARARRTALMVEELSRRCGELETVDRLTGLPNHRAFQEFLAGEFPRAERYGSPLSLILIDIDRFRSLNESYGHLWGDRLLQAMAGRLRGMLRGVDMAARYGGEEFALLLPQTGAEQAARVAGRARGAVRGAGARSGSIPGTSTMQGMQPIPDDLAEKGDAEAAPTVSLGIATYPDEGVSTRGLLVSAAESALRRAKNEGRNRAVAHVRTEAAVVGHLPVTAASPPGSPHPPDQSE